MIKKFTLAALCVFMLATAANASILRDSLLLHTTNELVDESVGLIVDVDGLGTVSEGDVIQGLIRFAESTPLNTNYNNQLYGVYSYEIIDISATGVVTLGAASGSNSIASLLSGAGVDTSAVGIDSSAVIALVESTTGIGAALSTMSAFNLDSSRSLLNDGSGSLAIGGQIDSDWAASAILGLNSSSNIHQIQLSLLAGFDPTSIAALEGGDIVSRRFGDYASSYTISSFENPGVSFEELSTLGVDGSIISGQLVTSGNNTISTVQTGSIEHTNGWHFQDDGNFQVLPTPEPATIAIWSALGVVGVAFGARRRFSKKS